MSATALVERAGLLTTIQDAGRWGHQASGVPVSGPMDPWSAAVANHLAGNPRDEALLEVTVTGPTLRFDAPARIGVAGARFELEVGGRLIRVPGTARVAGGGTVRFGARLAGCRAYLAIEGGVRTRPVLGSRSTHVRTGLGGRALRAGDRLAIGAARTARVPAGPVPDARLPQAVTTLRVVPVDGGHPDTDRLLAALCSARYLVSPQADRMGLRLAGTWPAASPSAARLSEPTVAGAIQIPPDGQPILLMADRQTTGGYAVPAVVCEADLGLAAQLVPGDHVRFETISLENARSVRRAMQRALADWLEGAGP